MDERPDIIERAQPFMAQCGSCDYGLPYPCNHPEGDYRQIVADLVREVERLRADLNGETS